MGRKSVVALGLAVLSLPFLFAPTSEAVVGGYGLKLNCAEATGRIGSMEADYRDHSGCWFHNGIHTYYVSHNRTLLLYDGNGSAFSVEKQFSPTAAVTPRIPLGSGVNSSILLERSIDGRSWYEVSVAHYAWVTVLDIELRQTVHFEFDGEGAEFRYLRVRQPDSLQQGLSGFLDHSQLNITVTNGTSIAEPTLTSQTDAPFDCLEDILEDVFLAHPCTFGGVSHWDSPSWFHTYPLENATLTDVRGMAILQYFRPFPPGADELEPLNGTGAVWSSVGGTQWTALGTFPYEMGTPASFNLTGLGSVHARFLRVGAERHPDWAVEASWVHPEAYLLFSELYVSGSLPS